MFANGQTQALYLQTLRVLYIRNNTLPIFHPSNCTYVSALNTSVVTVVHSYACESKDIVCESMLKYTEDTEAIAVFFFSTGIDEAYV